MPNGFHGSVEEWRRIESPLQALDATLTRYAETHQMRLGKNTRNWPDRQLEWGDAIHRKIQISLAQEHPPQYSIGVVAWQDRAGERYLKQAIIAEASAIPAIQPNLESLLEEARTTLERWSADDLAFATSLG